MSATDGNGADENALLLNVAAEIAGCEQPITMVLRPLSALHLAGLVQLAMRHPSTAASENHQRVATTFLEHVRAYFVDAQCHGVVELLRRGDDPAEDLSPRKE